MKSNLYSTHFYFFGKAVDISFHILISISIMEINVYFFPPCCRRTSIIKKFVNFEGVLTIGVTSFNILMSFCTCCLIVFSEFFKGCDKDCFLIGIHVMSVIAPSCVPTKSVCVQLGERERERERENSLFVFLITLAKFRKTMGVPYENSRLLLIIFINCSRAAFDFLSEFYALDYFLLRLNFALTHLNFALIHKSQVPAAELKWRRFTTKIQMNSAPKLL